MFFIVTVTVNFNQHRIERFIVEPIVSQTVNYGCAVIKLKALKAVGVRTDNNICTGIDIFTGSLLLHRLKDC